MTCYPNERYRAMVEACQRGRLSKWLADELVETYGRDGALVFSILARGGEAGHWLRVVRTFEDRTGDKTETDVWLACRVCGWTTMEVV